MTSQTTRPIDLHSPKGDPNLTLVWILYRKARREFFDFRFIPNKLPGEFTYPQLILRRSRGPFLWRCEAKYNEHLRARTVLLVTAPSKVGRKRREIRRATIEFPAQIRCVARVRVVKGASISIHLAALCVFNLSKNMLCLFLMERSNEFGHGSAFVPAWNASGWPHSDARSDDAKGRGRRGGKGKG